MDNALFLLVNLILVIITFTPHQGTLGGLSVMRSISVLAIIIVLILSVPASADVIRVPADEPTIQAGIDAAVDGDTVLVADGWYMGDGNRDIDFLGKAITVRSENGPEHCIIHCEGTATDYHRGFHFHSGEGHDSVLEGFRIKDGYVGGEFPYGGGIFCEESSPVIRNNIIRSNAAIYHGYEVKGGGGIACYDASPLITGNVIDRNFSDIYGGGIFCIEGSAPVITGNTISDNDVDDWYFAGVGAGVYAEGCTIVIRDNIIRDNYSRGTGGGLCCYLCQTDISGNQITSNSSSGRGTVDLYDCTGSFSENTISDNDGNEGLSCSGISPMITNNIIRDNNGPGIYCSTEATPEIQANTITGNSGGGIYVSGEGTSPLISGNRITGNRSSYGGGIECTSQAGMTLLDNVIYRNTAYDLGGGVYCYQASTVIIGGDNVISENSAEGYGGGLFVTSSGSVTVDSCRIIDNLAMDKGGGVFLSADASLVLTNVLLTGNTSDRFGGGIALHLDATLSVDNCTISNNTANVGGAIFSWGAIDIANSIVWGNPQGDLHGDEYTIRHSDIAGGWPGTGNMDADPLFVEGVLGGYYLSQTAAGQAADSGCVDAGDPASKMVAGTTRTDLEQDTGIVDMGYHYPLKTGSRLVTGPGPGYENPPLVRLFPPSQDAAFENEFSAYGAPHHGVNVSTGDVTGSFYDDILTGAGPGEIYGPHVRGFEVNGTPLPGLSFLAYGTSKYGVNVATGDIDGDHYDEIITGAGPGAVFGPHVRGWDYDGTGSVTAMAGVSYFAYGTPKWGVNATAGDVDGDGYDEIVTGAGPGSVYGPHVRGWDYDGTAIAPIPAVSFMAYGTNQFGVNVACGDVDGDGIDEIVTGPGPGAVYGTHVRGWDYDGQALVPLPGLNFFAWAHPLARYGAKVFAGADLDGDGRDELVVGCGPDPEVGTRVKVYRYDGAQSSLWFSLEAFEGLTYGTTVAAGRF